MSASPAAALTPAELIGPDLQPRSVSLAGISEGQISYFDEDRRLRREPLAGFVQVREIGGPAASGGPMLEGAQPECVLELGDGQRIVGDWVGGAGAGGVRWRHPVLGEFDVPLEIATGFGQIKAMEAGTGRRVGLNVEEEASTDEVLLSNGDRLRGFVAELTEDGLLIEAEGAPQAVTLPLDRVASVRLASTASAANLPLPGDCLVVLTDGSRLLASELVLSSTRAVFRPRIAMTSIDSVDLPLTQVRRIDFVGTGWQLVDLTEQEVSIASGGEAFGVPQTPRLERADVLLHAPVEVDFTLPDTATRLAATAALDLEGVPVTAPRGWADFELVIPAGQADVGGVVLAETRYRINAAHPVHSINLPVHGGKLLVRLEVGLNGPILDRLRLSDAVVLLKRQVAPADSDPATAP